MRPHALPLMPPSDASPDASPPGSPGGEAAPLLAPPPASPPSAPRPRPRLDRRYAARMVVSACLTSTPAVYGACAVRSVQACAAAAVLVASRNEMCDNASLLRLWVAAYGLRCAAMARLLYTRHGLYSRGAAARAGGGGALAVARFEAERTKARLDSLATVAFVLGALWLFGSQGCDRDAPVLTGASLLLLGLSFASLFFPMLFFVLLVCALPLALALVNAAGAWRGPAAAAEASWIERLPTAPFRPDPDGDGDGGGGGGGGAAAGAAAEAAGAGKARGGGGGCDDAWPADEEAGGLRPQPAEGDAAAALRPAGGGGGDGDGGGGDGGGDESPKHGGWVGRRRVAAEDAACVVCLGSYEAAPPDDDDAGGGGGGGGGGPGDLVTTLPCGHHFHAPCIAAWLRLNACCPLCKARCGPSAGDVDGEETRAEAADAYVRAAVRGGDDLLAVLI